MMVDCWNPRAEEAARLIVERKRPRWAVEVKEVLRTIVGRIEVGQFAVDQAELDRLRRLAGLSIVTPKTGVGRNAASRMQNADALHQRLLESGALTMAQLAEWASASGWSASYTNKIVVSLLLDGRVERRTRVTSRQMGRPLFVYSAK